jgi:hypothetical protein
MCTQKSQRLIDRKGIHARNYHFCDRIQSNTWLNRSSIAFPPLLESWSDESAEGAVTSNLH